LKRVHLLVISGLAAMLLMLAACVQEVGREGTATPPLPTALPATPTLMPAFTPVPTNTTTPTPTASPTVAPTRIPTRAPTPTPAPTPTEEPAPALTLELRAPLDGSMVRSDAVVVHGVTTPESLVDIAGVAAPVGPDGRFQVEITLSPGINIIRVVATDSEGNQASSVLNITSLALPPQPFLLLVTEPESQSIVSEPLVRLSGRTGPEAILSINGVSVLLDELGFFFTMLSLEPGPNIIDVVATNNDGRVLSTVIALIYRP